ncbi:glycosyltransferase family 4 protein [Haliscomenobacter sp.]|uniref:glycosyltransferase family 4 protein n=1 Tax=Haliscomenobacter sp. TaxID=2717303 RepID=UPI0033651B3E
MRPLKILMVCKSLPDTFAGGIQTHTWSLSGALLEAGHQVSTLTAGSIKKKTYSVEKEGRTLIRIPYFPGRKLPLIPLTMEELCFNLSVRRWLQFYAKDFDVIHFQGRSGGLVSKEVFKQPTVLTLHGLVAGERQSRGSLDDRIHGLLARFLEKRPLQFSRACIAVSDGLKNLVGKLYPGQARSIDVVPNGVESPKLYKNEVNYRKLLFVGRLDPVKGLEVLLEAAEYFEPGLELDIIGDGPDLKKIKRIIENRGLEGQVHLLGEKPRADVLKQMETSLALVLPSWMESQGVVLLEAAACGRPSVCTELPGTRNVIIDGFNGLRFPAGDAQALAKAINTMYAHPELADEYGRNGKKYVAENFSWTSVVDQTLRVYAKTLGHAA